MTPNDLDDKLAALELEYDTAAATAQRLLNALSEQLATVVQDNDIALAVPIEMRVKTWISVREKVRQKGRDMDNLKSVTDIAGIRLITLFQRDVTKLDKLIKDIFQPVEFEDTSARLNDEQFGYRSNHYAVSLPEEWQNVPSFRGLENAIAEIQVRTLPQHMWAAASHNLQYKREDSAPPQLRRSINRVSAILELIDIEFSRMLSERDDYASITRETSEDNEELNVDNLAQILAQVFPENNKADNEEYDDLLSELQSGGISKISQLKSKLIKGHDLAMLEEANRVKAERVKNNRSNRVQRGVYFQHVGLARNALYATSALISPLNKKSKQ